MKKITILGVFAISSFVYSMDVSEKMVTVYAPTYFCPLNPAVEKRHNVAEWQKQLTHAVLFNNKDKMGELLDQAGTDATALVCANYSAYGPILKATYSENKPEMRKVLKKYMDAQYCKKSFNLEKERLHVMWKFNASEDNFRQSNYPAESLVRDFYREDSSQYPLSTEDCEKLGIK